MIRRTFLIVALAACSAFAADTSLLSLIPAEATVAGGVAIARTAGSPFGQFVLSQFGQTNKEMQQFIDATGFDPRRDLQEAVFASTGQHKSPGVLIARGVFNGPQILNTLQTKNGGTLGSYRGIPILEQDSHAVAIAEGWLAVAGNTAMVKSALDRRAGAASGQPVIAAKAAETAGKYDAWMVTNGVLIAPLPAQPGKSNPAMSGLQGIVETSGGLTFGSLIQFSGEAVTRSNQDAQALVDVMKFFLSMVQMNAQNPEMQKLQPVLSSLQFSAQGTSVKMSFSIAEADLEQLMPQRPQPRRASARAAR